MNGVAYAPVEARRSVEKMSSDCRRCIVSGRVLDRSGLIRFVLDPEGVVVPDVDERLLGRGLWVSAERTMLQAAGQKVFARAARRSVRVPEDLCERVERLLLQRCQNLVGLSLRAGQATFGFEKTREWLLTRKAGLLVEALDGAPGECRKLRSLAPSLPVLRALTGAELAAAVGRERTVHGTIAAGSLASSLIREAARLSAVRAAGDDIDPVRPFRAVHST